MATVTYALHQLAPLLNLDEQAILHYVNVLQQHGYEHEGALFSFDDVQLLQTILLLEREHGFVIEDAVALAMSPNFDLTTLEKPEKRQTTLPSEVDDRVQHLAQSIDLLAAHMVNVEKQNEQLLHIIDTQQQQQQALFAQNELLTKQLQLLATSIDAQEQKKQARQLDRLEQQNTAVMQLLHRVNTQLHDQEVALQEAQKQAEPQSFFKKLFSK